MADLNVTLRNLLQNLNYQYAMASKQNAQNIQTSAKNENNLNINLNATNKSSSNTSATTAKTNNSNTYSTAKTNVNSYINSNLKNLLNSLSSTTKSNNSSAINNTSTVTNDMELEFFKSNKNAVTTSIYNKLQSGASMTASDLINFKNQVSKLSADEQKLWKSEIAKIEAKIEAKIFESSSTQNTNNKSNSTAKNTSTETLNGFVNNVLYKNGQKFSGIYSDGLYYQNGVIASGTINGKLYVNGQLFSGTQSGILYQNGIAYTGTLNGKTYKNGVVESSNTSNNNSNSKSSSNSKTDNNQNGTYGNDSQYLNAKTIGYLNKINNSVLTERLTNDIKIVKNAEAEGLKAGAKGTTAYQNAYDASIKSQMIRTTSNMTGQAGEVVEKDGSLYVNDGNKLVKLNISAETYLELFPPVERYDINQNSIQDCYFVTGCLTDMMKNGTAYAELLQMFSEDSNGNIMVKFAGSLNSYPVTFTNGQLKSFDGLVNGSSVTKYSGVTGSTGIQMLEQAYSIAKFAKSSNKSVNSIDIDETISNITTGRAENVYAEVLGSKSERVRIESNKVGEYLNSIANSVNNGTKLVSFASYGVVSQYGLTDYHAYSIEKIDTANQMIYITNPWYSGVSVAVPYSEFAKVAYSETDLIYFAVGDVKA